MSWIEKETFVFEDLMFVFVVASTFLFVLSHFVLSRLLSVLFQPEHEYLEEVVVWGVHI